MVQRHRMSREPHPNAAYSVSRQAAKRTSIQHEMKSALRKLGLPEDGPATEEITLLASHALVSGSTTKRQITDTHIGRS